MKLFKILMASLLALTFGFGAMACGNTEKPSDIIDPPTDETNGYVFEPPFKDRDFKVLGIGNSFTEDATTYAYEIAKDLGIENPVIGCAAIGGADLERIDREMKNGTFQYAKGSNEYGETKWVKQTTLSQILADEEWDLILLQQLSTKSGSISSFSPYMGTIIEYIRQLRPQTKLGFHMTWAFDADVDDPEFYHRDFFKIAYGADQMKMYKAITDTTEKLIDDDRYAVYLEHVIPAGTAIQNIRSSRVGDNCNLPDGHHLNHHVGRYTAALTWIKYLTGVSLDSLDFQPKDQPTVDIEAAKEAVENAVKTRFDVTQSLLK